MKHKPVVFDLGDPMQSADWLQERRREKERARLERIRARVRLKHERKRVGDVNPFHEPAGSRKGGRFAKKGIVGAAVAAAAWLGVAVPHLAREEHALHIASHVLLHVADHYAHGAVDPPIADLVAQETSSLALQLDITKDIAINYLDDAVDYFIEKRLAEIKKVQKDTADVEDPVLQFLYAFKAALKPTTKDFNPYHEPGGSSKGGQFARGPGSADPTLFVSPNVSHLNFAQAVTQLSSVRHDMVAAAAQDVDAALGLHGTNTKVIGAWADGAENALMVRQEGATLEQTRVSSAMKGWLANQKQVLVFKPDPEGEHFLVSFPLPGELPAIHATLLQAGLPFHTLEPTDGGATVHVYGTDQTTHDAIEGVLDQHNVNAEIRIGIGEFLGTEKQDGTDAEQRADARRVYEEVIEAADRSAFSGRDPRTTWDELRNRWAPALEESETEAVSDPKLQEMIHGDMSFTRGDDRQHVDSVDDLYARARAEEPQFLADIESLASTTGGIAKFNFPSPGTTLKPRASVERKLAEPEVAGDVSKIRDVLRATVVHPSVEGSRLACAQFIQERGDAVVRVKDRFVHPMEGYRDFLVNYRTSTGLVAEVQFNSRSMIEAKTNEGHKLYKRMGELLQLPSNSDNAMMLSAMVEQSNNIYERAYKRDGNGNWAKK